MGKYPSQEDEMNSAAMVTIIVIVVPIALGLSFGAFISWTQTRRQEREAYYKAETLRRITETPGDGARAAIELLREDERIKAIKGREGLKIGGLINVGIGVGLMIFLRALLGGGGGSVTTGATGSVYLCGLIPGLIGVAMLVYVYLLAPQPGSGPKG
jgi:hypothetical protein